MSARGRAPSEGAAPGELTQPQNGLARTRVSGIQRARMLAAMVEVACELGASNVTVADVVARSGVSRRTFYEIFEDREDCYVAAFDEALAHVSKAVLAAHDPGAKWADGIRASLLALLRFIDEEPLRGKLLIVESLGAGPVSLQRRSQILARVTAAVNEGRGEGKGSNPAPLTAEGVVGGALSVIYGRLLEEGQAPFTDLLKPLMAMIVLPYLGAAASRRELDRPSATERPVAKRARLDPLGSLGMRLTYRTMRVLLAIGSRPGSSNREVADVAGITDPGQMSKLLTRLHHFSLIENVGTGQARGEPNAWRLTKRGEEIEHAIADQTAGS